MKTWMVIWCALGVLPLAGRWALAEDEAPGAAAAGQAEPAAEDAADEQQPEMTEAEQVSYAIGMLVGGDFRGTDFDLAVEPFRAGFAAGATGASPRLTQQQAVMVLRQYFTAQREAAAKQNIAKGAVFLAENGKRDTVRTMPSGLQFEVLEPGSGRTPKADDTVTVHYRGTLIDGTEFDSSYSRGEPATFPLNRVIAGWTEGLQLMKEGGKYKLYVPSDLGYKDRGSQDGSIGPNATLIFEIELLEVQPADEPAGPGEGATVGPDRRPEDDGPRDAE